MKTKIFKIVLLIALVIFLSVFFENSFHKMNDFKVTHRAASRLLNGENLYNWEDGHYVYKYSPFFALLVAPFGLIPFSHARFLWMALMCASLFGVVRMGKYLIMGRRSPPRFFYFLSLLLIAKFLLREIELGQTDFVQLLFILALFVFLEKGKEFWGGLFLALSVIIKLTPLIVVPYLIYKKRFRALMWSFILIFAFFFFPSLIYGFHGNLSLLRNWYQFLSLSSPPLIANDMNQSIFGMFYRLLTASDYNVNFLNLDPNNVNALIYVIIIGSYICLLLFSQLSRKTKTSFLHAQEAIEYSFLLIFIALFSPLGWIQNFSSLVLASMVLVYYTFKTGFRDKAVNFLLISSFVLGSAINYEIVGRRLNDLALYYSLITIGAILIVAALSRLRLSRIG
jgi:hypothetical protein